MEEKQMLELKQGNIVQFFENDHISEGKILNILSKKESKELGIWSRSLKVLKTDGSIVEIMEYQIKKTWNVKM